MAKSVAKIVQEADTAGEIKKITIPYVKVEVESFNYNKGDISWRASYDVSYEQNGYSDLDKLEQSKIKSLSDYQSAIKLISDITNENKSQAESRILQFIQFLADGSLDEDALMAATFTFTKELEKAPLEWAPKIWLKGIWMEDDTIELNNGVIFKKPTADQLGKTVPIRNVLSTEGILDYLKDPPSVIMHLIMKAKGQPDVLFKIENIIQALRLFRVDL